jgi:H+/Cl- antiporter ClcA
LSLYAAGAAAGVAAHFGATIGGIQFFEIFVLAFLRNYSRIAV